MAYPWASLIAQLVKNLSANAGDPDSIPGSGRSTGEGIGYPLQYSWASLVAQLLNNPPVMRQTWVWSLGWEDPLEKGKATTPVFWPGEFHGLYSPWGRKELDTTEWLSTSSSCANATSLGTTLWEPLPCRASQVVLVVKNSPANAGDLRDVGSIRGSGRSPGGGHGNPFQYSCLENLMDRGAWWAAVCGVTKSRTWVKRLSTAQPHRAGGLEYRAQNAR